MEHIEILGPARPRHGGGEAQSGGRERSMHRRIHRNSQTARPPVRHSIRSPLFHQRLKTRTMQSAFSDVPFVRLAPFHSARTACCGRCSGRQPFAADWTPPCGACSLSPFVGTRRRPADYAILKRTRFTHTCAQPHTTILVPTIHCDIHTNDATLPIRLQTDNRAHGQR